MPLELGRLVADGVTARFRKRPENWRDWDLDAIQPMPVRDLGDIVKEFEFIACGHLLCSIDLKRELLPGISQCCEETG